MTADISKLLDELDALEAKATKGPWSVGAYGGIYRPAPPDSIYPTGSCVMVARGREFSYDDGNENEAFITALRNAYPCLRDALRKEKARG